MTDCPVCSHELEPTTPAEQADWVLLGYVKDKVSADFARETLASYDLPAVVISKSGFFGNIGLTLESFYSGKSQLFEVSVPRDVVEEATGVMDMILGDSWKKKE